MRRRWAILVAASGLVSVFLVGLTLGRSLPRGTAAHAQATCGNAMLSGNYGVNFTGTSQGLGRFASVSLFQFDGYGNFTANETFNSDQQAGSRSISGTYSVNTDCTFTLSYGSALVRPHDVSGVCVAVSGGAEFFCTDSDTGWVATGTGKKQ